MRKGRSVSTRTGKCPLWVFDREEASVQVPPLRLCPESGSEIRVLAPELAELKGLEFNILDFRYQARFLMLRDEFGLVPETFRKIIEEC